MHLITEFSVGTVDCIHLKWSREEVGREVGMIIKIGRAPNLEIRSQKMI